MKKDVLGSMPVVRYHVTFRPSPELSANLNTFLQTPDSEPMLEATTQTIVDGREDARHEHDIAVRQAYERIRLLAKQAVLLAGSPEIVPLSEAYRIYLPIANQEQLEEIGGAIQSIPSIEPHHSITRLYWQVARDSLGRAKQANAARDLLVESLRASDATRRMRATEPTLLKKHHPFYLPMYYS